MVSKIGQCCCHHVPALLVLFYLVEFHSTSVDKKPSPSRLKVGKKFDKGSKLWIGRVSNQHRDIITENRGGPLLQRRHGETRGRKKESWCGNAKGNAKQNAKGNAKRNAKRNAKGNTNGNAKQNAKLNAKQNAKRKQKYKKRKQPVNRIRRRRCKKRKGEHCVAKPKRRRQVPFNRKGTTRCGSVQGRKRARRKKKTKRSQKGRSKGITNRGKGRSKKLRHGNVERPNNVGRRRGRNYFINLMGLFRNSFSWYKQAPRQGSRYWYQPPQRRKPPSGVWPQRWQQQEPWQPNGQPGSVYQPVPTQVPSSTAGTLSAFQTYPTKLPTLEGVGGGVEVGSSTGIDYDKAK